eukprot:2407577-Prymnesium_polylepis.1
MLVASIRQVGLECLHVRQHRLLTPTSVAQQLDRVGVLVGVDASVAVVLEPLDQAALALELAQRQIDLHLCAARPLLG